MIKINEEMLSAKIPKNIKREVYDYCQRNGIKIKHFIAEALKDKLVEITEDQYDVQTGLASLKDNEETMTLDGLKKKLKE